MATIRSVSLLVFVVAIVFQPVTVDAQACDFPCSISENTNKIPFKSGVFCENFEAGNFTVIGYDQYYFRSVEERDVLLGLCKKTCGEIQSECSWDGIDGFDSLLLQSTFRDCCDDYGETFLCSYCPPGTDVEFPERQVTNVITGFSASCAEFESWFDLEYWSHRFGKTLDSYGPPDYGGGRYSCEELRVSDPIWSPVREWTPGTDIDCACLEMTTTPPSMWRPPTAAPSYLPTTAVPTVSLEPSFFPSRSPTTRPTSSAKPSPEPTERVIQRVPFDECSPKPSETFSSPAAIIVGVLISGFYFCIFYQKSSAARRPRWSLGEMSGEVVGQFIAAVVASGSIILCKEKLTDPGEYCKIDVQFSLLSLAAVDGFEVILTLCGALWVDENDHPGQSFDRSRWNELGGCRLILVRFLVMGISAVLPVFTGISLWGSECYDLEKIQVIERESLAVIIPTFICLALGALVGIFGPCVLRNPDFDAGGTRVIWMIAKELVGVIPGLIVAIANKDWVALGWGAELFIEVVHFLGGG